MKLSFSIFLLLSLILCSSLLQITTAYPYPSPVAPSPPPPSFCDVKCGNRCDKAGYKDRCMKYCGICCNQCKCVPSGTVGNKSECPCYRDKLNSKGKPKCP